MKNTKIHSILIPLDFSSGGDAAIQYGSGLANLYRADVFLLHILEGAQSYPQEWFAGKAGNKEAIKQKVTEKIELYAEDITKKYGVYVQQVLTTGNIALKITEAVSVNNIDLIVMGTHGASGFEELFLGSIARKIVNLAPCPVITIREGFKSSEIKSILLPIDESMHSRQKVSYIIALAARCNAAIHILGISSSNDKSDMAKLNLKLSSVAEAVKSAGLSHTLKIVKGNNIAMEAMKYAEQVNPELLAIMTEHESNMTGIFMGAFARQIVNHSKTPVISIKPVTGPYESSV